MKGNIRKWIFIGGAPRSGTSLLQAIFNQHSMCSSPPESHLLETFAYSATSERRNSLENKQQLKEFIQKDKWIHRLSVPVDEVLQEFDGNSALDLFRIYMEKYVSREDKNILVEGAPFNIWFAKKLYIDFPGCYILHIVRDPRDVIMSTLKANYNTNIDYPLVNVASQFMETYMQGVRFGPKYYGKNYIKVYYEDLVTRPEETIRMMCDNIGIAYEPSMFSFQESSSKVAAAEEDWKVNLSKPFLKDNFNKWKQDMKREDVIRVEYICREFFSREKEHYALSGYSFIPSALNPVVLPVHMKKFKKMIREMLNGKPDSIQLDNLPAYERLRRSGMTSYDR